MHKTPKKAQERAKRHQRASKRGQKQKGFNVFQKKLSTWWGAAASRRPGGGGGGKPPEFGSSEFAKRYLERFAPVVNDGCGGLSSLRATAAPLLEYDV